MSGPLQPEAFLYTFLIGFLESQLVNGLISTEHYYSSLDFLKRSTRLTALGRRLFASSPKPVFIPGHGRLRLIFLREPDGRTFPFL